MRNKLEALTKYREHFENVLEQELVQTLTPEAHDTPLGQSVAYALTTGGKRFRPLLCYATLEALGVSTNLADGLAIAVEYIHTYSLIHDDLPCMDDDDFRRGQPTTHKKFDEATALLAGDALLTEAFAVLARHYQSRPEFCAQLVPLVAARAGGSGMILGQALDLAGANGEITVDSLMNIHRLKTGGLISLCVEGGGIIAGATLPIQKSLQEFGYLLGLCFQIKDDLLDADDGEKQSFVYLQGAEKTQELLQQTTNKAQEALSQIQPQSPSLKDLLQFNFDRGR